MARYLKNWLIGLDQWVCTWVGGWPDETLSSYAYRLELQGKRGGRVFRPFIDWLFSWSRDPSGHCHAAWLSERTRNQAPPEFR